MELGQIEPGHSILNVVFIQNKMQTQNFTRPAYLIWYIIFQFLTIVYSVDVHHQTFLPQADFLFPQVEFVSFLMMILLKTDTKMHQRWNFFFQSESRKKWGMCFAYLSTELEQCKNIHQISKHHHTQVDMGRVKEFCFMGPSGFSLIS